MMNHETRIESCERASTVKAADLKAGDVIRIEYGDYGNYLTCTVISKRPSPFSGSLIIKMKYADGREREFCACENEMIEKIA